MTCYILDPSNDNNRPEIIAILPSRTFEVQAGGRVQIFCNAANAESISWLKNGRPVAYGATLYLENIRAEDQGEVICRAESRGGISELSAVIYVIPGKIPGLLC